MRAISGMAIGLLGVGVLACSGDADFECTLDNKAKNLTAPFNDMCLQIGTGDVAQEGTALVTAWENGDVSSATNEWETTIEGSGWGVGETIVDGVDGSSAEVHTIKIYEKGDVQVGFMSGQITEDNITYAFVYMEQLTGENSDDFKNDNGKKVRDRASSRRPGARKARTGGDKGGKNAARGGSGNGGGKAGKKGKGGKGR
jgi:hypothetical protein